VPALSQWVRMDIDSVFVTSFANNGDKLFAGTAVFTGVYLSNDHGTRWAQSNNGMVWGLQAPPVIDMIITPSPHGDETIFAGGYGGIYFSTCNETSWTNVSTGLTHHDVYALTSSLDDSGRVNVFAATADGLGQAICRTTDGGTTWTDVTNEVSDSCYSSTCWVRELLTYGGRIFAGTTGEGVFLSTNNGANWYPANIGLGHVQVTAFAVSGSDIFVAAYGSGVFRSTNNAENWVNVNDHLTGVLALTSSGIYLFAGLEGGGVFVSSNSGTSWMSVNDGLGSKTVWALTVFDSYLFAGDTRSGVWRRPMAEMVTSVQTTSSDLPAHFSLDQNYPNPFNPTTTISFEIPFKSFVSLRVFDTFGRQIFVLVSESLDPGTYRQRWNASGLASGIYFYRLQASGFTTTKKFVLLR